MSTKTIRLSSTGKEITYPFPYDVDRSYVRFGALDYLTDVPSILMSLAEEGLRIRRAAEAFQAGDPSIFASFVFVVGFKFYSPTFRYRYVAKADRLKALSAGACAFCGTDADLTVDHITPVARGGNGFPENLQCLCRRCNSQKGART